MGYKVLLFLLFLLLVPPALLIANIPTLSLLRIKKKSTVKVPAVVVAPLQEEEKLVGPDAMPALVYRPVFQYQYDGITWDGIAQSATLFKRYAQHLRRGETVDVFIDPSKPQFCYEPIYQAAIFRFNRMVTIVAAIVMVVFIAFCVFVIG